MRIVALAVVVMLSVPAFAEDATPSAIFEKTKSTYQSMETYKAEGNIVADVDTGGMQMKTETSFSMLLKKPNLYLISWTQKYMPMPGMAQSGAVWSDGTQPYLYMGIMNAYSKMGSDEVALGAATGVSGGAAFTIPSLFLSVWKGQPSPFSRLRDPKIERTEKVGEEDCYVISGASTISKMETFWISKSKYLIMQHSRSLEPPEGGVTMPEMTDEQIEQAIKAMGQEVTEENKKRLRETMNRSREVLKTAKIKGSSTESYVKISSPEMGKKDFEFALPKGTVLKDSLFGGALSGSK
jgi:hypothetical protein